jgi:hypothetical protein
VGDHRTVNAGFRGSGGTYGRCRYPSPLSGSERTTRRRHPPPPSSRSARHRVWCPGGRCPCPQCTTAALPHLRPRRNTVGLGPRSSTRAVSRRPRGNDGFAAAERQVRTTAAAFFLRVEAGAGTISSYRIRNDGNLSLQRAVAGTLAKGAAPTDIKASPDGRLLQVGQAHVFAGASGMQGLAL